VGVGRLGAPTRRRRVWFPRVGAQMPEKEEKEKEKERKKEKEKKKGNIKKGKK
jgi:hypothetical protein